MEARPSETPLLEAIQSGVILVEAIQLGNITGLFKMYALASSELELE